ncbi:MAG: LamG domain-containing protein [Verrucomicrobia bacterium]|nr:LamG domain-containing protein [Verrucomicrobiota bacterium]
MWRGPLSRPAPGIWFRVSGRGAKCLRPQRPFEPGGSDSGRSGFGTLRQRVRQFHPAGHRAAADRLPKGDAESVDGVRARRLVDLRRGDQLSRGLRFQRQPAGGNSPQRHRPTRTNSPSGKALDCRNGGCVGVAPDDKLSPSSGLTVSCWVRTDQSGQDGTYILNRLYLGNDSGYQLGMASGKPFFRVPQTDNSHQLIATNVLSTGRWVHLAGTCDGKEIRLYVDGQPAGTLARYGKINSNNATTARSIPTTPPSGSAAMSRVHRVHPRPSGA